LAAKKLNKLENKYTFIVQADVYIKKENTSSPETGNICEIRLNVPGITLFAQHNGNSLEAAIAGAVSDLQPQLQKRKEKMKTY
jgi:putative sigma-54 modulation protein